MDYSLLIQSKNVLYFSSKFVGANSCRLCFPVSRRDLWYHSRVLKYGGSLSWVSNNRQGKYKFDEYTKFPLHAKDI